MFGFDLDEIIGISEAFDNIAFEGVSQLGLALVLEHSLHHQAALDRASDALQACAEDEERFRAFLLMSNIRLKLSQPDAANQHVCSALSLTNKIPPKLRQERPHISREN